MDQVSCPVFEPLQIKIHMLLMHRHIINHKQQQAGVLLLSGVGGGNATMPVVLDFFS